MEEDSFETVTVETDQIGRHMNITNTVQVAEWLSFEWPKAHKGAAYRKAVKAAIDYLEGRKDAGAVRKAFTRAAKEAGILVRESVPTGREEPTRALAVRRLEGGHYARRQHETGLSRP